MAIQVAELEHGENGNGWRNPAESEVRALNGLPLELSRSELLQQVEVIGIREGGLVECFVPFGIIDNEEVPVKEHWAASLAKQMGEIAAVEGGTGQHVPITLGYIEGEPTLKIMDGFHRAAGLRLRGEEKAYATVKLTNWNDLYDFRIFTAKDHAHVRFSRVVQWIREVWTHSGLDDKLSVEQAVLLYRFDSNGVKLGIDGEDVEKAKAWVAKKEEGWGIKAMTIHDYLKVAETVDPKLVHTTREKRRGDILEAPTQIMLKIFAAEIPNNFDLQNLIMDTAMAVKIPSAKGGTRSMLGPEIRALCHKLKGCDNLEEAQAIIAVIDWETWEPEYGETKQRALRRAHDPRHKGAAVLSKTANEISSVRERIRQSKDRAEGVTEVQKAIIKEARTKAQELIGELGSLVIELSQLAGEVPPVIKMQPATFTNGRAKEAAKPARRTDIVEHEGILDLMVGENQNSMHPTTIHRWVSSCLKGEVSVDEVPEPFTPAERRQFRVALSMASDMSKDERADDWQERFTELRLLENPALGDKA